ncbi:hypothetical protein FHX34_106328 [Actinoplanes teichomyceticus]|uniref:YozE SAM-like protein n=2 Tax=Actinoplanes teichomyceticus TaxID=1867 RepID=A0A561VIZ2_ACTTI|nr:hypothetical protein FHX34_106328 [Actinoplanes teichomyceticus]
MEPDVSFGAWLSLQTGRHDPVGDLARDFLGDDGCGRCLHLAEDAEFMQVQDVAASMAEHRAAQPAFDAFNLACAEWTGRLP